MLGTFGTKKNKSVEVSKPTFQERLGGVKSMFKRAYEDALRLDTEMQASIDSKKEMIASIEADINTIATTKKEARDFMSNLEKVHLIMVKNFKVGDVLSESSHYVVTGIYGNDTVLKHQESGDSVHINKMYIEKYLESADEVINEVKVTKEDKKDGTLGIRSIFESIHGTQVFTVCFKKQDTPKSQKKLNAEIATLISDFSNEIDTIQKSKKGVADAAKRFAEELITHPILPYEEGEDRVLRGFKIQFESRDGRYNCVDMDIEDNNNIRPVNINTIKWLIIGGTKYVVE